MPNVFQRHIPHHRLRPECMPVPYCEWAGAGLPSSSDSNGVDVPMFPPNARILSLSVSYKALLDMAHESQGSIANHSDWEGVTHVIFEGLALTSFGLSVDRRAEIWMGLLDEVRARHKLKIFLAFVYDNKHHTYVDAKFWMNLQDFMDHVKWVDGVVVDLFHTTVYSSEDAKKVTFDWWVKTSFEASFHAEIEHTVEPIMRHTNALMMVCLPSREPAPYWSFLPALLGSDANRILICFSTHDVVRQYRKDPNLIEFTRESLSLRQFAGMLNNGELVREEGSDLPTFLRPKSQYCAERILPPIDMNAKLKQAMQYFRGVCVRGKGGDVNGQFSVSRRANLIRATTEPCMRFLGVTCVCGACVVTFVPATDDSEEEEEHLYPPPWRRFSMN